MPNLLTTLSVHNIPTSLIYESEMFPISPNNYSPPFRSTRKVNPEKRTDDCRNPLNNLYYTQRSMLHEILLSSTKRISLNFRNTSCTLNAAPTIFIPLNRNISLTPHNPKKLLHSIPASHCQFYTPNILPACVFSF